MGLLCSDRWQLTLGHSALSLRVFGEDITTAAKEAALKQNSKTRGYQEGRPVGEIEGGDTSEQPSISFQ